MWVRWNVMLISNAAVNHVTSGLLSRLTSLKPCSATTQEEIFHRTRTVIIFSTSSKTRCNSATGHVLLWVLVVVGFFFLSGENQSFVVTGIFLSLFHCCCLLHYSPQLRGISSGTFSGGCQMHFTQCRKTPTEWAAVGEDNETNVELIARDPHITDISTKQPSRNVTVMNTNSKIIF